MIRGGVGGVVVFPSDGLLDAKRARHTSGLNDFGKRD